MSCDLGVAFAQALHHSPHPAGALAARRALAAALMLVEIADPTDRADDVGRLVHDDDGRRAEAGAKRLQPIEIHRRVEDLLGRHQRNRRSAGNYGQQITEIVWVLAAPNAVAMAADQLAKADAHRFLDDAGRVHMARQLEQLGAFVLRIADAREPLGAAPQDRRHDRDALDIVDGRRAAVEARACRERRLQPRLALLALKAFEHRRLFAADVGAGAAVDEQVEVVARASRRSCRSDRLHRLPATARSKPRFPG